MLLLFHHEQLRDKWNLTVLKNGTVMFTKRAIPLQKPNRFMQETISTVHYTNKTVQRRDLLFMEDIPIKNN